MSVSGEVYQMVSVNMTHVTVLYSFTEMLYSIGTKMSEEIRIIQHMCGAKSVLKKFSFCCNIGLLE